MKTIAGFSENNCSFCSYSQMIKITNKFANDGGLVCRDIIVGSLCDGLTILTGLDGHYSFVFCEKHKTEWSSIMAYKRFKKLPAKYVKLIEAYERDEPYAMSEELRNNWERKWIHYLCA